MQQLRIVSIGVGGFVLLLSMYFGGRHATADQPADLVEGVELPTGKSITPTAARGAVFQDLNPRHPAAPDVRASGAAAVAVAPSGKLLAILTSGYNQFSDRDGKALPELSTESLFFFDITAPQPRQIQVLPLHATFQGLAWAPSSDQLFASGGVDDAVVEVVRKPSQFSQGRIFRLGHRDWVGSDVKLWNDSTSEASGLAVSPDGTRLLVANLMNDSVSLVDLASGRVRAEQDLRPGMIDPKRHGQPGGSYPRTVVWTSSGHAYVASERDREIIALSVAQDRIRVTRRMPVDGQPAALTANASGSRLYVALDTTNQVAIFDTTRHKLIEQFDVFAPESIYANTKKLGGGNTNALALTPDERTLLVSNGGENAIAVVRLSDTASGLAGHGKSPDSDGDDDEPSLNRSTVVGLVPTGWYPAGVATSKDGATWYVVNGKSPTGPNGSTAPMNLDKLVAANQHIEQLERAGFLTMPKPAPLELARLTRQVARNNRLDRPDKTAGDERLFAFLQQHIKHVIYIMKENRSYDQVLGDLEVGNGDPRLTLFPENISPNHHAIARRFVTLDNILVSGEGSMQGWSWTESAQTTDLDERNEPMFYAGRAAFDGYGNNRNISMGYATSKLRHAEFTLSPSDPDILPGMHDVMAPDGPGHEEGKGYLWDVALRRGRTVRNWGLAPNPVLTQGFSNAHPEPVAPGIRDPHAQGVRVFWSSKASLMPYSDPYFRTFYPAYPDYWRAQEWKREFAEFCAANSAPDLMLMWLGTDHTGWYDKALDGVNTPETQVADNDYALGQVIEAVANSPFAKDTLIVSIEDDAWDGADHVDAHRTVALFAGPYVRQHAVVSTRYTTVSVVKTIEEILGIGPIGLNDALASPMSDVFDPNRARWSYKAIVPHVLRSTQLPLPPNGQARIEYPKHDAAYWTRAMADQDFSGPDRVNAFTFNRELWRGLMGATPYPVVHQLISHRR